MTLCTLAGPNRFALEARKSRFLAQSVPAPTPSDALALLSSLGDASASHNCWAYRIDSEYRFSDDGEPGGTAGRPILAAIDQQGMDRVLVVVTRWYGGINLGAGGLARAYGGSAAECLRTAERLPLITLVEISVACDFALANAVHSLLRETSAQKVVESFNERGLSLRLRLPASMVEQLTARLRDISRGTASIETGPTIIE